MSCVYEAVLRHAKQAPARIAIDDGARQLTYAMLASEIAQAAQRLREAVDPPAPIALLADNGTDWAIADLAALVCGIPLVPLPLFFSIAQMRHALLDSGSRYLISNQSVDFEHAFEISANATTPLIGDLRLLRLPGVGAPMRLANGVRKVTFTSGTTAEPKGVCLTEKQLEATASSLYLATRATPEDRHLCLLPLATLLENIGGLYTPLIAGASVVVPPLAQIGLSDSSGLNICTLIGALNRWQPSSIILVPQMLQALVKAACAGMPLPASLRFVAVGGAPVSRRVLDLAEQLGLPVYEGYGLSECASVVALNQPGERRVGSVGKPLPHLAVQLAADGEIIVQGTSWPGYVGDPIHAPELIATGDVGYLDEDGYLYVTGRKKSIFITAFGRNIAPEWVERELVAQAPIAQAALFGDQRPFNTAIVVARPDACESAIAAAIDEVNGSLPDYARVGEWFAAREPFSVDNGMLTPNGRLRRAPIFAMYARQLAAIYED